MNSASNSLVWFALMTSDNHAFRSRLIPQRRLERFHLPHYLFVIWTLGGICQRLSLMERKKGICAFQSSWILQGMLLGDHQSSRDSQMGNIPWWWKSQARKSLGGFSEEALLPCWYAVHFQPFSQKTALDSYDSKRERESFPLCFRKNCFSAWGVYLLNHLGIVCQFGSGGGGRICQVFSSKKFRLILVGCHSCIKPLRLREQIHILSSPPPALPILSSSIVLPGGYCFNTISLDTIASTWISLTSDMNQSGII